MKKFFWALCLLPALGFAGEFPCVHLKLKVKNQTQSVCHLIGIKADAGQVFGTNINDLPILIPVGQISDSFTLSENGFEGVDFSFTFECGENKTITINAKKGLCRRNAIVEGAIYATNGLNATFEESNGLYWGNQPGNIVWTLTDM